MVRFLHCSLAVLALSGALLYAPGASAEGDGAGKMGPKEDMGELDKSMSEEALAQARLHFKNGVSLLQENPPNYQDAYHQFQLALEKSGGSWKVRGNLGFCALKLERDGEALRHYRQYLSAGGDAIDPEEREDIESELLLLKGNLATVSLTASEPDAQINVERSGSSVPVQPYALEEGKTELGLRAGAFTITATNGSEKRVWEPVLTPGQSVEHHFDFAPVEKGPEGASPPSDSDARPPASEQEPRKGGQLRTVGYATAGVGLLALGGGAITGLLSQNKEEQAKEGCLNKVCPSSNASERDSAESLATTANVLFIAGGVLAATGVTLVILGGAKSSKETASLEMAPGLGPQGGALFARGTF